MTHKCNVALHNSMRRLAKKAGISIQKIKTDDAYEPELFQLRNHLGKSIGGPASILETFEELRMQAK